MEQNNGHEFKFNLHQCIELRYSGEQGVVKGRAHYTDSANAYYVTYRAGDGCQRSAWLNESELVKTPRLPNDCSVFPLPRDMATGSPATTTVLETKSDAPEKSAEKPTRTRRTKAEIAAEKKAADAKAKAEKEEEAAKLASEEEDDGFDLGDEEEEEELDLGEEEEEEATYTRAELRVMCVEVTKQSPAIKKEVRQILKDAGAETLADIDDADVTSIYKKVAKLRKS